jgi:hypothetical protein
LKCCNPPSLPKASLAHSLEDLPGYNLLISNPLANGFELSSSLSSQITTQP